MVTLGAGSSGTVRSVLFSPEVNMANVDHDWWIDSGANVHICSTSSWFSSLQVTCGGSVTMGNNAVAQVIGIGEVVLKLSSGKNLIL